MKTQISTSVSVGRFRWNAKAMDETIPGATRSGKAWVIAVAVPTHSRTLLPRGSPWMIL